MELLCERPVGMSFETYKKKLRAQKTWLRNKRKGIMVWISCVLIPKTSALTGEVIQPVQFIGKTKPGRTFRGFIKDLKV